MIGESHSGKSSVMNAIRRLRPEDLGGAGVKIRKCTRKSTPYDCPNNPKEEFWDQKIVGTNDFP